MYFSGLCDDSKAVCWCVCAQCWKSPPHRRFEAWALLFSTCPSSLFITAHQDCYGSGLQWASSWGNWQFDFQCHSLPSFLTCLLIFLLFFIPRVMIIFIYSWPDVWFWFIRPCLWGLCVVQIWVGRPDRSSAHISDWLCYLGQVTGDLEPVVTSSWSHLSHLPHRVMGEGKKKKKFLKVSFKV